METCFIDYCGRRLEVPLIGGLPPEMPFKEWDDWGKSYCGAGDGLWEWIVPEKFPGGTVATPVCYLHDIGSELAETPEDYAQNDRMFMSNLVSAIFGHHPLDVVDKEHTDLFWALNYYIAVDTRNKQRWQDGRKDDMV